MSKFSISAVPVQKRVHPNRVAHLIVTEDVPEDPEQTEQHIRRIQTSRQSPEWRWEAATEIVANSGGLDSFEPTPYDDTYVVQRVLPLAFSLDATNVDASAAKRLEYHQP